MMKGDLMELYLQNTIEGKDYISECFTTDNPKIKEVTFNYIGTEDNLTDFLKITISDYMMESKLLTN